MTTELTEEQKLEQLTRDEKASLKAICDQMGITYSNNATVEKLKTLIQEKKDAVNNSAATTSKSEPTGDQVNPLAHPNAAEVPTKVLTLREYLLAEQMKLVRIRITCMDPKKADLPGEIFTFANEHIGTVKKYVPFGEVTDNGYHVPYCIYEMLRTREFLQIRTVKKSGGRTEVKSAYVREFSIDVLPDLTEEELNRLRAAQASRGDSD